MTKPKRYSSKEFKQLLKKNGYWVERIKGSHYIYTNQQGNIISVPKDLNVIIALRLIKENNLTEDTN